MICWVTFGLTALTGCAAKPQIYDMPPEELKAIRSDIHTVGVWSRDSEAETEVDLPAKGSGQGFVRGAAMGATTTVIVFFLAPVPLSNPTGIILAPLGALIGSFYGAAKAMPSKEVDAAERLLNQSAQELRKLKLRDRFLDEVVETGNRRTDLAFMNLTDDGLVISVEEDGHEETQLECDAILDIRVEKTGLDAPYSVDPPIELFVQVRARLIRNTDGRELFDEVFFCRSDVDKKFKEWTLDDGLAFREEFKGCGSEMAEKIIEEFFLVYRISRPNKYRFF